MGRIRGIHGPTLGVWLLQGPKDPDVEGSTHLGSKASPSPLPSLSLALEKQWQVTGVGTHFLGMWRVSPGRSWISPKASQLESSRAKTPSPARPWLSPHPSGTQNAPLLLRHHHHQQQGKAFGWLKISFKFLLPSSFHFPK